MRLPRRARLLDGPRWRTVATPAAGELNGRVVASRLDDDGDVARARPPRIAAGPYHRARHVPQLRL